MWGLVEQIKELRNQVVDLEARLKRALEVNEMRLDEIAELKEEILDIRMQERIQAAKR